MAFDHGPNPPPVRPERAMGLLLVTPTLSAVRLVGTVAGNSPSDLGTTSLPWLERTRTSSSEDASACVVGNDLCDLLSWRVCSGPSDSVSLSQDHGKVRNHRRRLLVPDTSCVPHRSRSTRSEAVGEPPRVGSVSSGCLPDAVCSQTWPTICLHHRFTVV